MNLKVVEVWERLKLISFFQVNCGDLRGQGSVKSILSHSTLTFEERGMWANNIEFTTSLRWILNESEQKISLEHLRYGQNRALFLMDLVPDERGFASATSHLCKQDCYRGYLTVQEGSLVLEWHVAGPHKNYKIKVVYN